MKSYPLVSILVPSYNSDKLIERCLTSLLSLTYSNYEIILIDDCSTDKSIEIIKERFLKEEKIRFLENRQNLGPSKTRNRGIKEAGGKYVAFFETDMEADKNWISEMVKVFEKNPQIEAAHSRVFDLRKKNLIQADGMYLIPHTGWVVMRNYGRKTEEADNSQTDVIIGSVGTFVRRRVLERVGGFDETLGHKVDDLDLGWRIWIAGYRTISVPSAVTYHWGGKPSGVRPITSLRAEYYFNKMPRVFVKNYESVNLIKFLPWLLFLLFARAAKHLFTLNTKPIVGFIQATSWFIWNLPDSLRERKKIQSMRKFSDKYIIDKVMVKGNIFDIWKSYVVPTHQIADSVFASK